MGTKSPKGPPGGPRGRNNFSKGALRVPPGGSRKCSSRVLEGLGSARAPSRNPIKIEVQSTFHPPGTTRAIPEAPRERFGGSRGAPGALRVSPGALLGSPGGAWERIFGRFFGDAVSGPALELSGALGASGSGARAGEGDPRSLVGTGLRGSQTLYIYIYIYIYIELASPCTAAPVFKDFTGPQAAHAL